MHLDAALSTLPAAEQVLSRAIWQKDGRVSIIPHGDGRAISGVSDPIQGENKERSLG
jgi:hypothetical protein